MAIYFDTASTTPLLEEVKDTVKASLDTYGNPSSLHHQGVVVNQQVNLARKQVLHALGSSTGQLVFTGSGTEANNLAVFGTAKKYQGRGRHLVTTQVEHPSVLESVRALERQGWSVTYVPPEPDGNLLAQRVLDAVTSDTVLVSMMHVNNETGAVLPVQAVGEALKSHPKVLFHVDGIQAFGKITTNVGFADLYSLSGHKIGAPKGIGALYIRPNLVIDPVIYGGGQEGGLRSGTENVLGIVSLGVAAELNREQQGSFLKHVEALARLLVSGLAEVPGCRVNRPAHASPYIISAAFPGLKGEVLVHALESQGLYVSTGSACSTRGGRVKASHVLGAMGKSTAEVTGTIRFSLGNWHSDEDIQQALAIVKEQTQWLLSLL